MIVGLHGYGGNKGVCRARNEGIKLARFPIVVNMDHDCIPSKGWLSDLVKGFEDEDEGKVKVPIEYDSAIKGSIESIDNYKIYFKIGEGRFPRFSRILEKTMSK